jgi:PAS domain S-box-containing protein
VVWSDVTVSAVRDADGDFQGTITQLVDVTAEVEEHQALTDSEERYRVAVRNSGVAMSLADAGGVLLDVNPTMCDFLGRNESQIKALTWRDVTHPHDVANDQAQLNELLAGTRESYRVVARYLRPDGDVRVGDLTRSIVRAPGDGSTRYVISQIVDVTAESEARDQLEYQAGHDDLTGLRNRAWILDSLDTLVRAARRTGIPVAVLFSTSTTSRSSTILSATPPAMRSWPPSPTGSRACCGRRRGWAASVETNSSSSSPRSVDRWPPNASRPGSRQPWAAN